MVGTNFKFNAKNSKIFVRISRKNEKSMVRVEISKKIKEVAVYTSNYERYNVTLNGITTLQYKYFATKNYYCVTFLKALSGHHLH